MKNNVVKLSKIQNRKTETQTYYKYIITIPKKHVDELNWSEKSDLEMKTSGKKLVIEKV